VCRARQPDGLLATHRIKRDNITLNKFNTKQFCEQGLVRGSCRFRRVLVSGSMRSGKKAGEESPRQEHRGMESRQCSSTDLNENAWQILAPLIPAAKSGGRLETYLQREIVNAVLYLLRTGGVWRLVSHNCHPGALSNTLFGPGVVSVYQTMCPLSRLGMMVCRRVWT
jgi:hypothetical protein